MQGVTLFSILRMMIESGQVTTENTFHVGMGNGEKLFFDGQPLKFRIGVQGKPSIMFSQFKDKEIFWNNPTDVAYLESGQVIAYAAS